MIPLTVGAVNFGPGPITPREFREWGTITGGTMVNRIEIVPHKPSGETITAAVTLPLPAPESGTLASLTPIERLQRQHLDMEAIELAYDDAEWIIAEFARLKAIEAAL